MTDNVINPVAADEATQEVLPNAQGSTTENHATGNSLLANGLKILGELALSPGTSLLLDGKVTSGIAHVGVGFIARRMLGLPGLLLVGANSYSQSVSGKSLLEHAQTLVSTKDDSLGQRVKNAINEKIPLDEILATVAEDVEDNYHKLINKIN